jgi:fucose permease
MQVQRAAGLGAYGAAAGLALVFALFVWSTRPGPGTGMDWAHAMVSWISVGGIVAALIVVHVLVGRVLVRNQHTQAEQSGSMPREST